MPGVLSIEDPRGSHVHDNRFVKDSSPVHDWSTAEIPKPRCLVGALYLPDEYTDLWDYPRGVCGSSLSGARGPPRPAPPGGGGESGGALA